MTPKKKKKKTPEQKAKAVRSVMFNKIRNHLIAGDEKGALHTAKSFGVDIFEARLRPEYQHKSEPWFVAKEAELRELKAWDETRNMPKTEMRVVKESVLPEMMGKILNPTVKIEANEVAASPFEPIRPSTDSIFSPEVAALEEKHAPKVEADPQELVSGLEEQPVAQIAQSGTETPVLSPAETQELDGRLINGWPYETKATIWGFPRNPRMSIAILPDGVTKVSVWKSQYRQHRIHDPVTLRMDDEWASGTRTSEPVYCDCSKRSNTW